MTAIYVTHDQEEALMLSDRIALMHAGKLVEVGTPRELYLTPTTEFGATFLGAAEIIAVTRSSGDMAETELGPLQLGRSVPDLASVAIRPEAIVVEAGAPSGQPGRNRVAGRLASVVFSGRQQQLVVELVSGRRLNAQVDAMRQFTAGEAVQVVLLPERLMPLYKDSSA